MGEAQAFRHAVTAATHWLAMAADAIVAAVLAPCCAACGQLLDAPRGGAVCPRCWDEAAAMAGRYDGALRQIIHACKYDRRRSLARPLGTLLRQQGERELAGANCVVPVPLHPLKHVRRGFNQASLVAYQLERPVVHALWRTRATVAQAGLTAAERRRNVRDAFRLSPFLRRRDHGAFIRGRVVVLVDDVTTTGATLAACAAVLAAAGAREVRTLTLARAPLDTRRTPGTRDAPAAAP